MTIADRFAIGGNGRFVLFAGPCVVESEKITLETAEVLKRICERLEIPLVFKSSFDKANRSSAFSPRGMGIERGLKVLQRIKSEFDLPIVTDVHEVWQCAEVADVADVLQIPAFLCRQTDLLMAAACTGRVVNVKKGQFLAPWEMKNVLEKMHEAGNDNVLLCERGTTFGYNNLVVDMAGVAEMRSLGAPVVFDATHSVQKPCAQGTCSGGNRAAVPCLVRAAMAVGVDGLFAEVHPCPEKALSDTATQLPLSAVEELLTQAIEIDRLVKNL
ncbi:MAG: 3-deoxy-8-phosphooctulonate synthase [Paludibacteraceae bacterium]|nr:3-deoxy-8-phosphooctulonate synthase [Paludibacteraceae bacterium]